MKQLGIILITALGILAGCKSETGGREDALMGVQSILWSQYAAEVEALYLQAYNIAGDIVSSYKQEANELPPAVTLDIDETVLDNSPFNVNMLREGLDYSEEIWAEWCEKREAGALPGVLDFTLLAKEKGVEVFYISNRKAPLLEATLDNMRALGFPNADSLHVLLKTNTSSKDARREKVGETHKVILLIGDNLGDFDGIFDERSIDQGKEKVRMMEEAFGTRFIIVPNVMYGSWERAVFPDGMPDERTVLEHLKGY